MSIHSRRSERSGRSMKGENSAPTRDAVIHIHLSKEMEQKLLRLFSQNSSELSPVRVYGRPESIPSDVARDWMRGIEKKLLSVESLEEQVPDLEVSQLEVLLSAARHGTRYEHNRALAVLAHFMGSVQLTSVLSLISQGNPCSVS